MNITNRYLLTILVLLAGVVTSCAWSVPASPGLNAMARTPKSDGAMVATSIAPGSGTDDPATETLYLSKCGRCHVAHQPSRYAAGAWPFYVHKYGPRAGLFGEERMRVLEWLQANAR